MPNLIVTFSQSNRRLLRPAPVAGGAGCRTEAIEIGAESEASDLVATADEEFVELYAEAACWVTIGNNPTAQAVDPSTDSTAIDARWP
jgi:hypothetical protein